MSIAEGQSEVGSVKSSDVDGDVPRYTIVGGADAAAFVIDNQTGDLRMKRPPAANAPSDANRDNVYEVTVEVSDGQGGTADQAISVLVLDVNKAPSLEVPFLSVPASGHLVLSGADLIAHDPDSPASSLMFAVSDLVHGRFELASSPGVAVTTFSETALESGQVVFVHEAGSPAPEFTIAVTDGRAASAPLRVQTGLQQETRSAEIGGAIQPPDHEAFAPERTPPSIRPSVPPADHVSSERSPQAVATISRLRRDESDSDTHRAPDGTPRVFKAGWPIDAATSVDVHDVAPFDADPMRTILLGFVDRSSGESASDDARPARLEVPIGEERAVEWTTIALSGAGIALTAGSVWWALRFAGLLGTLFASLPAWRQIDLLPILADKEDDDADWGDHDDEEAARDEAAVGRHFFSDEGVRR